ncbi:MAG: YggS family pyridoxal phosphate-dependent enzyme [Candidatus Omnitrophica bacterium]|nr:YggS family pyridoxal phosphate-dependent enzyme [Candidatus Omnitrophota bacterium]
MIKDKVLKLYDDVERVRSRCDRDYPRIVLVSKFVAVEEIREAYHAGHRVFGENRVQELTQKIKYLPSDIEWHFVGHLQTNKVKDVVAKVTLIHSVDSLRLAETINEEAQSKGVRQACLLQINTSREESKFGIAVDEFEDTYNLIKDLQHIDIKGLMTIGAFTDDQNIIRKNFCELRNLRDTVLKNNKKSQCRELSMGMTHDWHIALEEGATYLRIGTLVFGERKQHEKDQ